MTIQSLSSTSSIELLVNERGHAVLLHKGALHHEYGWFQFEPQTETVQLITEKGAIQELGFVIPAPIKTALRKTMEITLIEVNEDSTCRRSLLLPFTKLPD